MRKKQSRSYQDTTVPSITAPFEDVLKALLRTPPPPAGHPATRKQKPTQKRPKS